MVGGMLRQTALVALGMVAVAVGGCTSLRDYVHNGFKVGPNHGPPCATVAQQWIDSAEIGEHPSPEELSHWWTVFNDPVLDRLIADAYRQNLSLREACFRVLQARAQLGIAVGGLFPQQQTATGSFSRQGASRAGASGTSSFGSRFSDSWNMGFQLAWEIDVWGRYRRAIEAADANLDASVAGYDDVLVTLLGDVAQNYTIVRTLQERIELLKANVELQKDVLDFIEKRLGAGFRVTQLDLDQAQSNLAQTEAAIPQLETDLRIATNRLCILLGMPPVDIEDRLGTGPIPTAPPEVAIGIPAELLRRRPDVRQAERLAAAQAQQIGISEAELYPAFIINGNMGYQARQFSDLFTSRAFQGSVGPSFQWNILNYGRIINDVRYQDARFWELVVAYQNTVLRADAEVEDGLVTFLRAQRRARLLDTSVTAAERAVKIVVLQYEKGAVDFNRYATIEQSLVQQQDLRAQARGQIAQGLILVYRALGGGWEMRFEPERATVATPPEAQP